MELVLLGTGNPIPDSLRAGPATLVRAGGQNFLFDCGRGVLMRLAAAGVFPGGITAVFLTHLHSDHTTDFNDIVTMRWAMSPVPLPLAVYGPPGTRTFVDRTLAMLTDDIGFRLAHHADLDWHPPLTVTEVADGDILEFGEVRVAVASTDHAPVKPTVGFRIESGGAVIAVAGDTVPCEGLDQIAAEADLYVQTVIRRSLVESIPVPRLQDILDYHSSIEDAAKTASKARAKTLVMTHLVPAPAPGTEGEWIAEAAALFDGEIVVASDGMTLTAEAVS